MKLRSNLAVSDNGFVFDPNNGDSYNLNQIGQEILQLLKSDLSEKEITKNITEKYDVEENTFEQNLFDFIGMLNHYDLLDKSGNI